VKIIFSKNMRTKIILLGLVLIIILSGCTWNWFRKNQVEPEPPAPVPVVEAPSQGQVKKFANLTEFKKFVESKQVYNQEFGGIVRGRFGLDDGMMPTVMNAVGAEKQALESVTSPSGSDYSQTNLQVAGVDEADIIKTDGKYVYTVSQKDLMIIDASPAQEAKVLTTINFKNQPQEIFLSGNLLVVIGLDYNFSSLMDKMTFIRRPSFTFIKVFDVSDRRKPKELRSVSLEGDYSNSRLINNYLYLITNSRNYLMDPIILPRIYENDRLITAEDNTDRYLVPDIYYFDFPYHNFGATAVNVIDIKDNNTPIKSEVYLLPGGETVYMSPNALYIAYGKYLNQAELMMQVAKETTWPKLPEADKMKIAKIEAIEDYILSPEERLEKINRLVNTYLNSLNPTDRSALESEIELNTRAKILSLLDQLQTTVIHKISVDKADLKYQGFMEVPGRILNQFSLDESNGYFRVATTRDAASSFTYLPNLSDKRSNALYVLDGSLKIVGRLEGLAPDEQIYSVRFIQQRAYLVTFQQTDPLFVIDLSQATAPKVLGELKIPGFSQYLHPYNDNLLIGLGRDTGLEADGRVIVKGLKLALFDVSNVSAPKEIAKVELGGRGSDSEALLNHKAFLFSKEKNLIAIPARLTKELPGQAWGELDFNGALIFQITDRSLSLKGKISHQSTGQKNNDDYQKQVKRILYLGDNLCTVSDQYLQLNRLDNLTELKKVELRQNKDYNISN